MLFTLFQYAERAGSSEPVSTRVDIRALFCLTNNRGRLCAPSLVRVSLFARVRPNSQVMHHKRYIH
jgi:hypothetical protein